MIGSSRDEAIVVRIDDRAAVREALLHTLTIKGLSVEMSSSWDVGHTASILEKDWHYSSIVIHHAGNSHMCSADSAQQLNEIKNLHAKQGYDDIGYHFAVACDGKVFEARDIRHKGEHVKKANTGKIGIVLLADLSPAGEAMHNGPSPWRKMSSESFKAGLRELAGQAADTFDVSMDRATEQQETSLFILCETLREFFPIADLGGHREYVTDSSDGRACPGKYGLLIASALRRKLGLAPLGEIT